MSTDCIVLGAGIVGVSVALRLAQQGVHVVLVDAGAPSCGTTGTSGSLVGSNEKRPYEYYRLGVLSMAAMRRLAAELEPSSWFLPTGHLEWADSVESQTALDERVAQLREWSYPVHRLTAGQVTRDLEPELIVPAQVQEVIFFSDDSIIYPHLLIAVMLRRVRALGVSLHFGQGTATVNCGPDGVRGVTTGGGETLVSDVVVCCAGRWTERVLSPLGVSLPMVSPWANTPEALGFQVITTGVAVDVRRMIRMPGLSIRPAGGGRLMLHGRPEETELHAAGPNAGLIWDRPWVPPPRQADALVNKARRVLQNMDAAQVQSATAAVRALPDDGHPVVGWAPGHRGLYIVVSHSGIGLGPLLGELVADEILGREAAVLRTFRPDRFVGDDWRSRTSPMRGHVSSRAPVN